MHFALAAALFGCGPADRAPASSLPVPAAAGSAGQAGLGLRASRAVDLELRWRLELPDFEGGVVVDRVYDGGPAAVGGLAENDVLLKLDGVTLGDSDALASELERRSVGQDVTLQVFRGHEARTLVTKPVPDVPLLERACGKGDAWACGDLGDRHRPGRGVTRDAARQAELYRRACDGGDASSCRSLATMYASGEGVPSDGVRSEALRSQAEIAERRRACDGGDDEGCRLLGIDYEYGKGAAKDAARAAALYRRACDGGNATACTNLGSLHEAGTDGAIDRAQAAALHRKACDDGSSLGCRNLGRLEGGGEARPSRPLPSYDGIYRGRIAGKDVAVLFLYAGEGDGTVVGQYAYRAVGKPLGLVGRVRDGAALVEESQASVEEGMGRDQRVTGRWHGTFSKTGFGGEWRSPDGTRRHEIALSRQVEGNGRGEAVEPGSKAPRHLQDVFAGEIVPRRFVEDGAEAVAGEVAYRMMRQEAADVAYPRLTRHPDPAVMARVNADLEQRHVTDAAGTLSCSPSLGAGYEHNEATTIELFSRDFLSLHRGGLGRCGGPFYDWQETLTYDLRSGKAIALEEEFSVTARTGRLSAAFLPTFMKHLPAEETNTQDQGDLAGCYADDAQDGDYRVWLSLSARGLVVRTDFDRHVAAGCEAQAILPFSELSRYRRKDSPYHFGANR